MYSLYHSPAPIAIAPDGLHMQENGPETNFRIEGPLPDSWTILIAVRGFPALSRRHLHKEVHPLMDTLERIKKLFVDKIDLKKESLRPEASLDSLGLDSLDKIEFLFALEKEFDIKIPDREVTLNSLQDIVTVVERLTVEQRQKEHQDA
jgi:acyl carrier protein